MSLIRGSALCFQDLEVFFSIFSALYKDIYVQDQLENFFLLLLRHLAVSNKSIYTHLKYHVDMSRKNYSEHIIEYFPLFPLHKI